MALGNLFIIGYERQPHATLAWQLQYDYTTLVLRPGTMVSILILIMFFKWSKPAKCVTAQKMNALFRVYVWKTLLYFGKWTLNEKVLNYISKFSICGDGKVTVVHPRIRGPTFHFTPLCTKLCVLYRVESENNLLHKKSKVVVHF